MTHLLSKLTLAAIIGALVLALTSAPALAQPAYEPNDSILTGYGPLANNSSYTAALETGNDLDYFYFYVTTPNTAQTTFTVTNLGGGLGSSPEFTAYLADSHGSDIETIGYGIDPADYATRSVTLSAGKYFVVVDNSYSDEYGESYRLDTSGTDGAFGNYAAIAAACATATAPVTTYLAQVGVAEAKLRKAEARLQQLRYSRNRRARVKARAKVKHIKSVLAAEKTSLKAAEKGQKPWCFIPA
jgi:hypothetical protein